VMQSIQASEPGSLGAYSGHFKDPRLPEMLFRYRARNYPEQLDSQERLRWAAFVQTRRVGPKAIERRERLRANLLQSPADEVLQDLDKFLS